MDGSGSGRRWHWGAKNITSEYRSIDVRCLQRDGLLEPGRSYGWQWSRNGETVGSINIRTEPDRITLNYRHRSAGDDWEDKTYPVYLDWTDCNLGGKRPWFLCPARNCSRRVAKLFGGEIFACRHCHQLAYPSQRETPDDRAARRAENIREKLDWEPGILNGEGCKPKGMHWKTFERLSARHDDLVQRSLLGMALRFNLPIGSVDDWV